MQKAPEIITDDFDGEYRQLAYNKSALLVRKKRIAAITVTLLTVIGSTYLCNVLVSMTPFDNALKRWALKYWGFREGKEAGRWKELAKLVQSNLPLDTDGTSTFSSKIKNWQDLDQVTKAMMADNVIDTLIGVNGTGECTWKVNPNKREHRKLYDDLRKIKEAIDRKYKDQCPLKKITAKDLPELKAWYVRLLGAVPEWFSNLFKFVKAAEPEPVKLSKEQFKRIDRLHEMAEKVLEAAETDKENRDKMKLDSDSNGQVKNSEGEERAKVGQTKTEQAQVAHPETAKGQNLHVPSDIETSPNSKQVEKSKQDAGLLPNLAQVTSTLNQIRPIVV
ncbi:hypothetical protein DdX_19118 [Ditylenchus destructor]|uniref:Uncharacterized protein n=1 Tax=Ditylenchus destructor TaxID=166010 RepID=A0AAD4QXJ0_9BILA|nr:hypothetical protein DdX_19118 [Ditylenchus destructor]